MTNTGPSVIYGSVAGSSGTPAVTGLSAPPSAPAPGTVMPPGVLYQAGVANSGPGTPFGDATAAYTAISGEASTGAAVVGGGLSGATLTPGVYDVASATTDLTGVLTLNAQGSDSASWVFIMSSTLTTASASDVIVENAGGAGNPFAGSITWEAPAGATLGSTTTFLGTILSDAGDTLDTGATIGCGRVISLDASVTLDANVIDIPSDCLVTTTGTSINGTGAPTAGTATGGGGGTSVPEPSTFALLLSGLLAMGFLAFRKSRVTLPSC